METRHGGWRDAQLVSASCWPCPGGAGGQRGGVGWGGGQHPQPHRGTGVQLGMGTGDGETGLR